MCTAGSGSGANLRLFLSVGPPGHEAYAISSVSYSGNFLNFFNFEFLFFFFDFFIVCVAPEIISTAGSPIPTTGGALTISGNNFATTDVQIYYGDLLEKSCEIQSITFDEIVCTVGPGTGSLFPFMVKIGPLGFTHDIGGFYFSYSGTQNRNFREISHKFPPLLTEISATAPVVTEIYDDIPTIGGPLTFMGSSFGNRSQDAQISLSISGSSVLCPVSLIRDDLIVCNIPLFHFFVKTHPPPPFVFVFFNFLIFCVRCCCRNGTRIFC